MTYLCLFLLCLSFVVVVCVFGLLCCFSKRLEGVSYSSALYYCCLLLPLFTQSALYYCCLLFTFLFFKRVGGNFILKCPILLSCLTSTAVHYWFARARCKAIQPREALCREALCREALCHTAVFLLNAHSMPVSVPKWWLTRV